MKKILFVLITLVATACTSISDRGTASESDGRMHQNAGDKRNY